MEPIIVFFYVYVFVFGSCIASFMNVVIYRVPKELNVAKGRSFCPSCNKTLKPYDMIPVLSWIILKGKCRFCGEKISIRYPLVELVGGLLGMFCFFVYGFSFMTLISFSFSMILVSISLIDNDTMIIPDSLVIACLIVSIISIPFTDISWLSRIGGIFIISVPLCLINCIVPDSFGGGDIKLLGACGMMLGTPSMIVAGFIGILIAGIYAIYLMVTHRVERKGHIAFGPYLCFGLFIGLIYGQTLMNWYLSLYGL